MALKGAVICFCFLLVCVLLSANEGAAFTLNPPKIATHEVQRLVYEVKARVEEATHRVFPVFSAVSFRAQPVAGTNYVVKVKVGIDEYIHVRIHQAPAHVGAMITMVGFELNKRWSDPITFF